MKITKRMARFGERILKRLGYVPENGMRQYMGAIQSRLTADWFASSSSADSEIRSNLVTLRNRCRSLERDNDYVRRYFKLLENNVLGHAGIGLQMKIREMRRQGNKWIEAYDRRANSLIESAWHKWGERFCSVNGAHSWCDIQRLALRSVSRDGAVLVRKHYDKSSPFGFALELIEIDHLDTDFNQTRPHVRLGVEYDSAGRKVAYHILRDHPGELFQNVNGRYRERVPAGQIIHLYFPERVGQTTGVPWLCSAIFGLKMLGGYIESELVASRVAAAKMGFLIKTGPGPGYPKSTTDGARYMETEPGAIEQLPDGLDFKPFDPTHPSTAFKDFVKATLRGIGAGLGVSYVSLANDLESVNYSSIRAGLLEEREEWKTIQRWFISSFVQPVFDEWLSMSLSFGAITDGTQTLPASKLEKFNAPEWKPRRWDWVDPLNDLQAAVLSVEKGFNSRRAIISERGEDVEDVFQDIAADEALAEEHDLDFSDSKQEANAQQSKPDKPDDPEGALTKPKD